MRVGRRVQGPGAVAHFDGLGVFRLLSLVPDDAELRAFAEETLGQLARADGADRRGAPTCGGPSRCCSTRTSTSREAARQLHFHYNTLRYRIAKLERLLGPFGEDPQLRLSLQLALQILRMREP